MDIKTLPDEDLAVYVREVDLDAYREVVSRFELRLLHYANHMVGNELRAHAIVQEAFLNAFQHINQFNPRLKLSNFMYRETHKELVRFFKENGNTNEGIYESLSEEFESEDSIENEFTDPHLVSSVKRHARHLPIKYREPLVLHFLEQKSYDEVVEILQVPSSSVAVRIAVGKSLLKKHDKA